jgi:hypothetical protein
VSLRSQLLLIEQALHAGQHGLLPALQNLYVQSHTDAALAWSDLAWLRLRTGTSTGTTDLLQAQFEALALLQQAMAIRGDCWQALDGLCEVHHQLGDAEQAAHHGRLALHAKHVQALQAAPDVQPTAMARRYWNVGCDLRVVAFSLFGQEAFYSEAAIRNAQDVARWYPGWICRFYVGADVSAAVKQRLSQAGAEVVLPPRAQTYLPGTVWRFMALDDLRVKTVLFRDADSLITEREAHAVQQWLASDCQAHVMRDHAQHSELILAGLWGAHAQSLRGVGDALLDFFNRPFHPTHADQHFLRVWAWPRIWLSMMQHDSALQWHAGEMPEALNFPRECHAGEEHVGHAPTQWTTLNLPGHWPNMPAALAVQLQTSEGQLLGNYVVQRGKSSYTLRLPPHAIAALESGQWRLNALLPMDTNAKA